MKNILSICCLAVISSYSFAQDRLCDKKNRLFIGARPMSRHLYAIARCKFSHLSRSICVAATVLGATQIAMAGPTVDQLSDC